VPATLHVQEPTPFRHSEVTSPNWELVPFEVGCARCGHDLRGLAEPKCPSCGLEFEWSQAVPIEQLVCRKCSYHLYGLSETRCPECGEPFTWAEALEDYHRKRKPLFEYHWRDRPFRSLVYTWWLALRPWKLWRIIDLHDPPRIRPLLVWVALAFVLFFVCLGTGQGLELWCWNNYAWTRIPGRGWIGPDFSEIPAYVLRAFQSQFVYFCFLVIVGWVPLSLLSLLIFQQSMRRCRVRTPHVVRAWAYGVPTSLPIITVLVCGSVCLDAIAQWHRSGLGRLLVALIPLHVVWSLTCAYSRYLKIPHALGVAFASQIIAVLAAFALPRVMQAVLW